MSQALQRLGHEVVAFPWSRYFHGSAGMFGALDSVLKRAQNKYLTGPTLTRLNRDLFTLVSREAPQALLVYRGTHIFPRTLRDIRRASPATVLVGYNNDDPFAPNQFPRLFKHFLAGIPEYDLMLALPPPQC